MNFIWKSCLHSFYLAQLEQDNNEICDFNEVKIGTEFEWNYNVFIIKFPATFRFILLSFNFLINRYFIVPIEIHTRIL